MTPRRVSTYRQSQACLLPCHRHHCCRLKNNFKRVPPLSTLRLAVRPLSLFSLLLSLRHFDTSWMCQHQLWSCSEHRWIRTLGTWRTKMNDGFKTEGIQRKKDYENLEEKMRMNFEVESAKMEAGFKNEENARQLVPNELAVMKAEIKNLKMGS